MTHKYHQKQEENLQKKGDFLVNLVVIYLEKVCVQQTSSYLDLLTKKREGEEGKVYRTSGKSTFMLFSRRYQEREDGEKKEDKENNHTCRGV